MRGYRATAKRHTRPVNPIKYKDESSKIQMLYHALKSMTDWQTASQDEIDNFLIVKAHAQYWRDKFAGRNPSRPAQEIDWQRYK